jgi:hypothetical protein
MTRDDIIRLAFDAHLLNYVDLETPRRYFIRADADAEEVERFAAHVAALEREACAKVCDGWSKRDDDVGGFIGRAIRARGEA